MAIALGASASPALFFYAGVFAPQDDLDVLARALSRLKAQGMKFRLLWRKPAW
jgi:hypothetical protein